MNWVVTQTAVAVEKKKTQNHRKMVLLGVSSLQKREKTALVQLLSHRTSETFISHMQIHVQKICVTHTEVKDPMTKIFVSIYMAIIHYIFKASIGLSTNPSDSQIYLHATDRPGFQARVSVQCFIKMEGKRILRFFETGWFYDTISLLTTWICLCSAEEESWVQVTDIATQKRNKGWQYLTWHHDVLLLHFVFVQGTDALLKFLIISVNFKMVFIFSESLTYAQNSNLYSENPPIIQ